jgi:hypothetical protein
MSQASRTRLDLIPKLKRIELLRALLQMTMETEDTTERLSAPTVLAGTSPLPPPSPPRRCNKTGRAKECKNSLAQSTNPCRRAAPMKHKRLGSPKGQILIEQLQKEHHEETRVGMVGGREKRGGEGIGPGLRRTPMMRKVQRGGVELIDGATG